MLALEYAFIALAGAALSLLLVRLAAPALWLLVLPPGTDIGLLIGEVMPTALAIAASAAVMLTLVTAVVQGRVDPATTLRDGARGSTRGGDRIREGLVVAQLALTIVLAVGAGLFVRSMMEIADVEWGFETQGVAAIRLSASRLGIDAAATGALAEDAAERLRGVAGVSGVALGLSAPLRASLNIPFRLRSHETLPGIGGEGGLGFPTFFVVTPEYLDVMDIALLRGRNFTSGDHGTSARVALVDATMARTFWPDGDALGQCIHLGPEPAPCTMVVGVVEDTRRMLVSTAHSLRFYLPLSQNTVPYGERYLFVRAAGAAPLDVSALRRALADVHTLAGAAEIEMLSSFMEPYTRPWRLGTSSFLAFGVLAQVIATLGLYGITAFGVVRPIRSSSLWSPSSRSSPPSSRARCRL